MGFSETFLSTGLPAGRTASQLLFDVLVSPRLISSSTDKAPLTSWPDLLNWPLVHPTWQVVVKQGETEYTFTATEVPPSPPYDSAAWTHMFPPEQLQQPYRGVDNANTPIFSYPAATVRDTVRDIHVNALINSRNEFPKVEDLRNDELFGCMLEAADPHTEAEVRSAQLNGPVADADVECHQAFAMANILHGIRPGSTPPPVITSVDPTSVRRYFSTTVTLRGLRLGHTTRVGVSTPGSTGTGDGSGGGGSSGPPTPLGTAATFHVVSDTEVTFETPIFAPTGAATIELRTPSGNATAPITFVLPGNPSVSSVSPDRFTTPSGSLVTAAFVDVSGTNFIKDHTTARLTNAAGGNEHPVTVKVNTVTETGFQIIVPGGTPTGEWYVRVETLASTETPVGASSKLSIEQVIAN